MSETRKLSYELIAFPFVVLHIAMQAPECLQYPAVGSMDGDMQVNKTHAAHLDMLQNLAIA